MTHLGDARYEVHHGRLLRRLSGGDIEFLAVKGRPGFEAEHALGGVLYRVEWLADPAAAAVFAAAEEPRAAGNCIHLTCHAGATAQWWCYRPREYDAGTISLLHAWQPQTQRAA